MTDALTNPRPGVTVLRGLLAYVGVLIAVAALSAALEPFAGVSVWVPWYFMGLVQILWVLPWSLWAFLTRRKHFGLGIVLGAALTLLFNGACFVVVVIPLTH